MAAHLAFGRRAEDIIDGQTFAPVFQPEGIPLHQFALADDLDLDLLLFQLLGGRLQGPVYRQGRILASVRTRQVEDFVDPRHQIGGVGRDACQAALELPEKIQQPDPDLVGGNAVLLIEIQITLLGRCFPAVSPFLFRHTWMRS